MTTPAAERFWNVPNTLSVARLVLAVGLCALIGQEIYLGALLVFVVAALTDWFDGYLARKLNQATAIGRQLDPLVDKVIVAGCYIYLVAFPSEKTGLYPWMVTVILARELIVQALRSLIEGRGQPFGARWAGKFKTTFQFLSIIAILLGLEYPPGRIAALARDALTWGAVALTVYSGWGYLRLAWPALRGEGPPAAS